MLRTLDEMHSQQETVIMELAHNVDRIIEKIEDGCRFTERVQHYGSGIDLMMVKKMCVKQLWSLQREISTTDTKFSLQFLPSEQAFENAIDRYFGSIVSNGKEVGKKLIEMLFINTLGSVASNK